MSVQSQIQALVDKLSSDLESLVRKAAVEAVQNVLGGAAAPARVAPKANAKRKPGPKPKAVGTPEALRAPAAKAAKPAKKGKRIRRSAAEIAATANRIHAYVKANPNANAERIKKALAIPNNQWGGPLGLLMSSKRLASKGEKRATTYSAR
jgi:hypothetical protein